MFNNRPLSQQQILPTPRYQEQEGGKQYDLLQKHRLDCSFYRKISQIRRQNRDLKNYSYSKILNRLRFMVVGSNTPVFNRSTELKTAHIMPDFQLSSATQLPHSPRINSSRNNKFDTFKQRAYSQSKQRKKFISMNRQVMGISSRSTDWTQHKIIHSLPGRRPKI